MDHRQAIDSLASERYLLNEMTEAERESFEEHYFSCTECADDVRAGALMSEGAKAGWAAGSVVRPAFGWSRSPVIPWALAATLAVAVGYQTLRGPASGSAGAPGQAVALTPLTLRAASRGAEPSVTAGPGGLVTLAVDLGDHQFRRLSYELRTSSGSVITSGEAAAPSPGAPLMLIVPSTLVHQSEHYVLTISDPGNADLTKGEYRFRVEAL